MMLELLVFLSAVVASFFAGIVIASMYQLRGLRTEMQQKVIDFAEITKQASAANLSIGEKLIEVSAKVENIESWRGMMNATVSQAGWKK